VFSVILDPVNNAGFVSSSVEFDRVLGLVFWIPEKSRITLNIDLLSFIESSIKVSQNNIWVSSKGLSSSFKFRGNFLAMSAPGSVDFKKNFFLSAQNCILEAAPNNSFDMSSFLCWDRSRFQERLYESFINLINKSSKSFRVDIGCIGDVFFLSINQIDQSGGAFNRNTKIFSESFEMITILLLIED